MLKAKKHGDWVIFEVGMTWPLPDNDLSWRLRYSNEHEHRENVTARQDLMRAASILNAYHELVFSTKKKRDEICSALKKGLALEI